MYCRAGDVAVYRLKRPRIPFLCKYVDYLKHVEYVRDPGPGVVGRVHEKADDLKIPDKAHAQE
jgi:hypothetical protein